MNYLKIRENGIIEYPYATSNLKNEYPNTSFPENLTNTLLIEYNIYFVNIVPHGFDYTKNYTESTPILINGEYYQNWIISDATTEQINQRLDGQWLLIKSTRNQYLLECDWTQLSDSPLTTEKKAEWAIYRQELRDITIQEDPFNIVWPTKP